MGTEGGKGKGKVHTHILFPFLKPQAATMDWSERYSTPLNDVFSRQHKLELEWRVELALLKALGEVGLVPKEAHGEVEAVIKCEEEEGERAHAHAGGAADAGHLRAAVRRVRGRGPRKALQRLTARK